MAVHTYIGARYVPRFMGVYDPTQIYEALDVVDNGSGTSYIARNMVPAGTPLTDNTHWFVYGASGGAIIQLQNDMIQAQNDITAAQNDITSLQGDVTTLDNKIAEVAGEVLIIGNSYVGYGVADRLKKIFNKSHTYTAGGIGFVAYTGHTQVFEDLIDNAIADATLDKTKITDIIFVSAMGDTRAFNENNAAYRSSLRSTLSSIQAKIAANFTNVKKVSITLAESRNVAYFSDNKYSSLWEVHQVFKKYSCNYGIEYLGWSGFAILFESAAFQNDDYHPSVYGADKIGTIILQMYRGDYSYAPMHASGNVAFKYQSTGCTMNVNYTITPERVVFSSRRIDATANGAITATTNNPLIESSDFSIPLPIPVIAPSIGVHLYKTDGTIFDFIRFDIGADSNGMGQILCGTAPTQSNVGTSTRFYAGEVESLIYDFYSN